MPDSQEHSRNAHDATLISQALMVRVINAYQEKPPEPEEGILPSEPVLSDFFQQRMLQIAGRLALAGAGPGVVRSCAGEVHEVLVIMARAFHEAYVTLLADLFPWNESAAGDGESPPVSPVINQPNDPTIGGGESGEGVQI